MIMRLVLKMYCDEVVVYIYIYICVFTIACIEYMNKRTPLL